MPTSRQTQWNSYIYLLSQYVRYEYRIIIFMFITLKLEGDDSPLHFCVPCKGLPQVLVLAHLHQF